MEGGNYFGGIEACNEILDGFGRIIGVILKHDSLCTRAALLLKVMRYIYCFKFMFHFKFMYPNLSFVLFFFRI